MSISRLVILVLLAGAPALTGQEFAGTYTLDSPNGRHTLLVSESGDGLGGTLTTSDGQTFRLEAQPDGEGGATGWLSGPQGREVAVIDRDEGGLVLTIVPLDPATGQPAYAYAQTFTFQRAGASAPTGPAATPPPVSRSDIPPAATPESGRATLRPGQQYNGGTRIYSATDGISFLIPGDWVGALPQGQAAFMLGSNTVAGVGLLIMRSQATPEEIAALIQGPQDLGDGVVLYPSGALEQTPEGWRMRYVGGPYVGIALGCLGPGGNGAVIFFAGPSGQVETYRGLVGGIRQSLQFSTPETSPVADQWRQNLSGMMLKRMSSYYSGGVDGAYVGGSSQETLHLCGDGTYAYASSSSVAADGGGGVSGYGSGGGDETGRWRVEVIGAQATLVLMSHDGSQSMHSIQMNAEGHTLVDGERAYRVPSDRCR